MNLSKLTPVADWDVNLGWGGGGGWFPYSPERPSMSQAKADADFIKLSRKAFDILIRRHWTVRFTSEGWVVVDQLGRAIHRLLDGEVARWPDPFTALVQADEGCCVGK